MSRALIAQDNDEEIVRSTAPDYPAGPTLPNPEAPVTRATNNTPTEGWMHDPSTDRPVDTVASIAAAISNALSTVEEGLIPEESAGVPAVSGTEQPIAEAAENEQAVVSSLKVPTSEEPTRKEAMSVDEEPLSRASVDEIPHEGGEEGATPVAGLPASVLDHDSAQVTSVVDGESADVVNESLVLVVTPVVEELAIPSTVKVSLLSISTTSQGKVTQFGARRSFSTITGTF